MTRPLIAVVCSAAVLASIVSCGERDAVVYVPGETFREELFVTSARGVDVRLDVGEPLVLHAQRRSGPWRAVPRDSLGADACSLASPPLELELEVADNVRWIVVPEGAATFDTDRREDRTRVVRFDAPGVYRVTAESSSWCGEPFTGDTLRIEVVE